ncbi:hypothetical protein [Phyllobacterium endophyticum]|uniref:hypothetical protein n=1 Tax=Phyllobacterium endophyticum TaxID=1149773 RepID=UPI0011CB4767|nr:hypothetical protein [Phyllobacterium endophyticum]TXR50494.1 hypothetical protein FVA77_04200 [Phyllobacterium endophyticum]
MTDGPFRNAPLSSRWKRYGQDLVSDAVSKDDRVKQACHSMLGDVDMKAFERLYSELNEKASRDQLDLDCVASTETIFDTHESSSLSEVLKANMLCNLREKLTERDALDAALASTVLDWIDMTKNRLDEDCIRARDVGDMSRSDYNKGMKRNGETFASIDAAQLRRALAESNKNAFKPVARRNVDESPDDAP